MGYHPSLIISLGMNCTKSKAQLNFIFYFSKTITEIANLDSFFLDNVKFVEDVQYPFLFMSAINLAFVNVSLTLVSSHVINIANASYITFLDCYLSFKNKQVINSTSYQVYLCPNTKKGKDSFKIKCKKMFLTQASWSWGLVLAS